MGGGGKRRALQVVEDKLQEGGGQAAADVGGWRGGAHRKWLKINSSWYEWEACIAGG